MSDYLSPGVYVEELPPQLRAIMKVVSTAGFVGMAITAQCPASRCRSRPGAGDLAAGDNRSGPPTCRVFSASPFINQFGNPLPRWKPTDTAYLWLRGDFFSNGGQIYISRVAHYGPADPANSASYGWLRLCQRQCACFKRMSRRRTPQHNKPSVPPPCARSRMAHHCRSSTERNAGDEWRRAAHGNRGQPIAQATPAL